MPGTTSPTVVPSGRPMRAAAHALPPRTFHATTVTPPASIEPTAPAGVARFQNSAASSTGVIPTP
jgi:hypothetical protein